MSEKLPGTLVDQKEALSVYFEALLSEPPEAPQAVTAPPVARVDPAPVQTAVPTRDSALPVWGENGFQAMLFKVAGLTLAVPLCELNGIQEWEGTRVTHMPGRAPWYLGLVNYRGRSVPIVDTARIVLPPDRLAKLTTPPQERIRRVVFIGEGSWGLGCDEVTEVVTLRPDQVRWRSERTKRKWLAGTVIEHMCALLEPGMLAEVLDEGMDEKHNRGPDAAKARFNWGKTT